jgi:chromosome partitioning protein
MVISVASQKGGTGKTTTSITLASGLARLKKKVLLIDVDSQANSSKTLLPNYQEIPKDQTLFATIMERKPLPIHKSQLPTLDVVPSHILLATTDIELTTAKDHREARLKSQIDKIKGEYDHIILDCPPALSWLTMNAFTASDAVLVVVSPGYFELDSLGQLGRSITEVKELFNPNLKLLGYLFTMSDPTVNSKQSLQLLRQTYTDDVLTTVIPRNTDIRDAHYNHIDIFGFNPKSSSANGYRKLIKELFGYEKAIS